MTKLSSRILLVLVLAPAGAAAHHGRDFLVTSSYKTPERGDLFGIVSTDDVRFNHHGESGDEFSPALLGEYGKGMHEMPDAAEGRVVPGKELGITAAAVNLIVQKEFEEDAHVDVRFAVGLRMSVMPWFGAGLEVESAQEGNAGVRLTPGISTALSTQLDVRLGASLEMEHGTLNALRSQLIYAF